MPPHSASSAAVPLEPDLFNGVSAPSIVEEPEPEQAAEPLRPSLEEGEIEQAALFGAGELEVVEAEEAPFQTIYVHFEDLADIPAFGRLIGLPITSQTRALSFPIEDFGRALPADVRGDAERLQAPAAVFEDPLAGVVDLLAEGRSFQNAEPIDGARARELVRRLTLALEFAWTSLVSVPGAKG